MQRVANYGSFLQAWALRRMLEELGAEVSFIDISQGRQLAGHKATGAGIYLRRAAELTTAALTGTLGGKLRNRAFYRAMRARYRDIYYGMLGLDAPAPDRFDLAVIGSDQVFNCLEANPWGFTPQLYGDIGNADRIISYAGSFGDTTVAELRHAGVAGEIADNLARLDAISVRDDNSWQVIKELTGREALRHLDPVLIYDFTSELAGRAVPAKDYIAIYTYAERITDRAEIDAICKFARSRGKRLISLFCHYDWCDESVIPPSPFDVLAWVRDADHVITDTFHGTIFSVITHSNFCTLVRRSNIMRLESLLRDLALEGRRVNTPDNIADILSAPPDYAETDGRIAAQRIRSREYLGEYL